jgi:HPt (histidine-containing phosphotransfer) domain-containing protein
MTENAGLMDEMMSKLRSEFLDTAADRLATMDTMLDTVRKTGRHSEDEFAEFRRAAHSLKGMGGTFGFPLVSVISHRLEDFLAQSSELTADLVDGVYGGDDPRTAEIVRALPVRSGEFEVDPDQKLDIEVMTVMPKGTATSIIEKELKACGYRVINVENPFDAIEYAVRTKPDLVMVSGVLTGLSGVDLANAFSAMPVSAGIAVVLYSSYSREHSSLRELPEKVPLVRKGQTFTEDLTEALFACGLT